MLPHIFIVEKKSIVKSRSLQMHLVSKRLFSVFMLTAVAFAAIIAVSCHSASAASGKWEQTAFVIIDIQNDYFKGGAMALEDSDKAGKNAGKLLAYFRKNGVPVIHVRHENTNASLGFFLPGTDGARIHTCVEPVAGETILLKHYPNSFQETDLGTVLEKLNIKHLVISGMQSNVCIRATTLEALKKAYTVTIAEDTLAAVNQSTHKAAVDELSKAGAKMVSSTSLMKR